MANKPPVSRLAGRNAGSGQFIPVDQARRQAATSVVERLPLPGHGEHSKDPKKP